jgi:hypothetical protein
VKTIELTKGYVALVDDEDYDRVNQFNWYANDSDLPVVYAERKIRTDSGEQTSITMQRFILGVTDPEMQVDHRDRNGLNNQKYNLTPATHGLSGHPKTGQRWSGQNRPTGRGRGLSCSTLQPPVEASLFSCANSGDRI